MLYLVSFTYRACYHRANLNLYAILRYGCAFSYITLPLFYNLVRELYITHHSLFLNGCFFDMGLLRNL